MIDAFSRWVELYPTKTISTVYLLAHGSLRFPRGNTYRSGHGFSQTIIDFFREYTNNITSGIITSNTKIILIGWAGDGHYELDNGLTHYTCVTNGVFMSDEATTLPLTIENIATSYHGLELTRLKVYHLEAFLTKTKQTRTALTKRTYTESKDTERIEESN